MIVEYGSALNLLGIKLSMRYSLLFGIRDRPTLVKRFKGQAVAKMTRGTARWSWQPSSFNEIISYLCTLFILVLRLYLHFKRITDMNTCVHEAHCLMSLRV